MVRCRAPAFPPNPHTSPPHDLQGNFVISLSQERAKNTVVGGLDVVVGFNDRFLDDLMHMHLVVPTVRRRAPAQSGLLA